MTPGVRLCLPISPGAAIVRPPKMSETVARDVVHDIVSQGLESGSRLPGEAQMLEQYGVSRESLREGLRLLEVAGLINIKRGPGGGPVVGHVDPANLGRTSSLYYHLAGGTYDELFEAWSISESLLAGRAARNRDRDTVRAAMAPYQRQFEDHSDDDSIASVALMHSAFHAVVASLAENRVLELLLQTFGLIVAHHFVVTADPRAIQEVIAADHLAIANAIAAGRSVKAGAAMEAHIATEVGYCRQLMGDTNLQGFIEWR